MIFERFIKNPCGFKGLRIRYSKEDSLIEDINSSKGVNQSECLDKLITSRDSTIVKTDISDFSDDESISDTKEDRMKWSSKTFDTWDRKVLYTQYAPQTLTTAQNASVRTSVRRSRFNSSDACVQTRKTLEVYLPEATQTWPFRVRMIAPRSGAEGWVRGEPAQVKWIVLDQSITSVRIDVCNTNWKVPTVIASNTPNDGSFTWRKVAWGMPSGTGYYLNIYALISTSDASKEEFQLIAQSDEFELVN